MAVGTQPVAGYEPISGEDFKGFQPLASMQLNRGNGSTFMEGIGFAQSQRKSISGDDHQTLYWTTAKGGASLSERSPGTVPYENTLNAIHRSVLISREMGKRYEVSAIVAVEGEADTGNKNYANDIKRIYAGNLVSDIKRLTGQESPPVILMSQPSSFFNRFYGANGIYSAAKAGTIYLVSPGYFLDYGKDNLHYTADSHVRLGEYFEKALHSIQSTGSWKPLMPRSVTYNGGRVIDVTFDVPKPPIVHDGSKSTKPDWGFEVFSGVKKKPIESVEIISPDTVRVVVKGELDGNNSIRYAMNGYSSRPRISGEGPSGSLRDSDDAKSLIDGAPLYNWAVHFYERF